MMTGGRSRPRRRKVVVGTWWAGELEDQGEGGGGGSEDRRRWGAETRKGGMYRLLVGGFIWVDVDSSRVIFGAFDRRVSSLSPVDGKLRRRVCLFSPFLYSHPDPSWYLQKVCETPPQGVERLESTNLPVAFLSQLNSFVLVQARVPIFHLRSADAAAAFNPPPLRSTPIWTPGLLASPLFGSP